MSDFRIFETEEFQKKLEKLHPGASRFVRKKLTDYVYPQLRKDPFLGPNIKKLKGYACDLAVSGGQVPCFLYGRPS